MFMDGAKRKAESAGGSLSTISTRKTALSQTCQCGTRVKKPLSLRRHSCLCGVRAQRDLYSAYLGLHVHIGAKGMALGRPDTLDTFQASTT